MAKWTFRIDDVYRKDANVAFNTMLLTDEVEYDRFEFLIDESVFKNAVDAQFVLDQVHPFATAIMHKFDVQVEAEKVADAKTDDILLKLKDTIGKEVDV